MDLFRYWLLTHWFGGVLLVAALVLGGWLLARRRRRGEWSVAIGMSAAALGLAGLGGLLVPPTWGLWLSGGALAGLAVAVGVLLLSERWWAPLGFALGAVLAVGVGGAGAVAIGKDLDDAFWALRSFELGDLGWIGIPFLGWAFPGWLLPLALVPLVVWYSFRSLAGLGPVRRWLAIGLRCTLIVLLTLALAEARVRHGHDTVTVLFLIDRSQSVPADVDPSAPADSPQAKIDRRWERTKRFVNGAFENRGQPRDRGGVIVFGRRPRLELPPSDGTRFNFTEVASTIDSNYTDIAAAIKLALASFPENSAKRIVLLSDGNENLGNALEQARMARTNGVQIDVVPLATGYRNEREILVQAIEAPPRTEQGAQLPIRVLIRSHNPSPVPGTLTLRQMSDGASTVIGKPLRVVVQLGINTFTFQQAVKQDKAFTYEAIFQPDPVGLPDGRQVAYEDRIQNNRATTHVVALGQRQILFVEGKPGEQKDLIDLLRAVGNGKYKLHTTTVERLPQTKAELAVFLSDYDCVVLGNVAASDVQPGDVGGDKPLLAMSQDQMEVLRSNTHDQGCGLIMIGGPNSYGAGGWQNTPIEKALPVDCEIKSPEIAGRGGLVLIMHASEMADGNFWQKKIAQLAIQKLAPNDMVGVLFYDFGMKPKWHIPFQAIGDNRPDLLKRVDRMTPGDMPDFDPFLVAAYDELSNPKHELTTRHTIIISDGDPSQQNQQILIKMREAKITCTTVGVATHGAPENQKMSKIAAATNGRFYNVKSASALPAIYIKETRLVSQSYLHTKRFDPLLHFRTGPTDGLPNPLPPLHGFVRTTLKPSPLVEMPIEGPPLGELRFPILAYWHFGLGKSVAFTSDARNIWDRDWAASEMYRKFWEQVIDWSLRAVETGRLQMTTDYRDGKVKVTVDARDKNDRPLSGLSLRGSVTSPTPRADDAKQFELKFKETNIGVYEAEFKAEEAGSYFITGQLTRAVKIKNPNGKEEEIKEGVDSIRAGVTIPYSPEFADLESNTPLLEKLREETGGKTFADDDAALAQAVAGGMVFRREGLLPSQSVQAIWYWLVLLAGVLLFFDVAVRRISIEPLAVVTASQRLWERLRGRGAGLAPTPQFLERLRSRKEQVGEEIDRSRTTRRFEPEPQPQATGPAPDAADKPAGPQPPPIKPAAPLGPQPESEPADFASRLLKAKKKVWEDRDKDK